MTDIEAEIAKLEAEHDRLVLSAFGPDTAWTIGSRLRERAHSEKLPIAIEVAHPGAPLFYAMMPGASPDNAAWIRRKRNVVERFWESSLLVARRCEAKGTTVTNKFFLDEREFVHSGGSIAIRLAGHTGIVGTITVSGLTQFDDHALAVWALEEIMRSTESDHGMP